MAFKTVLVHVDRSRHAAARIRAAAALARVHGALLVGVALTGIPTRIFPHETVDAQAAPGAGHFGALGASARQALAAFQALARTAGVPCETRLDFDETAEGLARWSRFADLLVIGRDDLDAPTPRVSIRMPAHVIVHAAAPVLEWPATDAAPAAAERIGLAWDGGADRTCPHDTGLHGAARTALAQATVPVLFA